MGFSRQEYWSGLPFPSPGDLPDPGIEPRSPALQTDTLTSEPPGNPKKESEVAQSCLALYDPMDCSPPGSSVHGILQARVLEWVAICTYIERVNVKQSSSSCWPWVVAFVCLLFCWHTWWEHWDFLKKQPVSITHVGSIKKGSGSGPASWITARAVWGQQLQQGSPDFHMCFQSSGLPWCLRG